MPGETSEPKEQIADNGGPGTLSSGTWAENTNRKDYGASYLLAEGGSGSTYTWTPTITGGEYEVYAWWVSSKKYSNSVDYVITHSEQQSQVTVDQKSGGGQWNLLGRFSFTGDGSESIQVSDTNGKTVADAVRLVEVVTDPPIEVIENTYYVHSDHLGTPQRLSGDLGQVVWALNQSPFGISSVDQDFDGDGIEVEMNLRFAGQYFDRESGLHYNYFRDYDPSAGRYIQSDPIGLAGGLNTYEYVENNPLKYIDRFGLRTILIRPPYVPQSGAAGYNRDLHEALDGLNDPRPSWRPIPRRRNWNCGCPTVIPGVPLPGKLSPQKEATGQCSGDDYQNTINRPRMCSCE